MSLLELDEAMWLQEVLSQCSHGSRNPLWKQNRQSGLLDTPGMVQHEPGDPQHTQSHSSG